MSSIRSSPASKRSKTSSGSRITAASYTWDEFNQTVEKPKTPSQKFLEKTGESPRFTQLHQRVLRDLKYTDMDIAASIIQNCWRKYRVKSYFIRFIRKYKAIHQRSYSSFFYNLAIQRSTDPEKRKRFFAIITRRLLWGRKLALNYHQLSFEHWNVCNLYLVPNYIDDEKLVQFVRKIYAQRMRNMLLEWLVVTRRNAKRRAAVDNFHIINSNHHVFKKLYAPFLLWKIITKNLYFDRSEFNHIPEIQNYNEYLIIQEKKKKDADKQHLVFVGKRVIQALYNKKLQKYADREQEKFGDEYNIKRCMKYSLKAWISTITYQKELTKTKMLALSKWHNVTNSKRQLLKLLDMFQDRHRQYQKLYILNIFKKNLHINTILHTHGYIKIQSFPSLARFFAFTIAGNESLACIASAMYGWLVYVRRRKNWQYFVSANIINTNYNHTKGKALAALRTRRFAPHPYGFVAPHFQMQTYKVYKTAINHQLSPFLLLSGPESAEIEAKISSAQTRYERRETFFQAWLTTKQDMSLFMRAALIANARARDYKKKNEMSSDDKKVESFKRAMNTLKALNLSTKEKFNKVQKEIQKNNEKALRNSTASMRRMMMLITAIDSHAAAIDFEKLDPFFRTVKTVQLVGEVQKASDQLSLIYSPLTDISQMGKNFTDTTNNDEPGQFERLEIKKPGFDKQFEEMKVIVFIEKKRAQAAQAATSHFSTLLNRADFVQENQGKQTTNTKVTTFAKNSTEDVHPRKRDGMIEKYSKMFPQYSNKRKLRISSSKELLNLSVESKEEEDSAELLKISRDNTKATLSSDSLTRSSFFSVGGFESALRASAVRMLDAKINHDDKNAQMPQINEQEEDYESETEEEVPELKLGDKKETQQVKKQSSKKIQFGDGFNDTIMKSALAANGFDDPDVSNRYKTFLQIMFGKQGRDTPQSVQIQQIKRKIINEYKNRKFAAPGIITQGVARPVTSVIESYRHDRSKMNQDHSQNKGAIGTKKIIPDKDMPKEFETKYNSRRYFTNEDFGEFEEDEEEDKNDEIVDPTQSKSSFKNVLNDEDRFQQEKMKEKEEIDEAESDEELSHEGDKNADEEIDAAAQQYKDIEDFNVTSDYIPGVGYTIKDDEGNVIGYDPTGQSLLQKEQQSTPIKKQFIDNGVALKSVNKVVHRIINELARTESEISFVEVDSLGPPELDLSQLIPPKEEEPPPPPKKPEEPPKRKWTRHGPPPKSKRPIVVPRMQTIKPSMAKAMHDDDNMTKIIYDGGIITRVQGEFKPPEAPREKKKWFSGMPDHHIDYFIEGQVVSFPGGTRQLNEKPHNFTQTRVNSVKNRGITKPIISGQPRPVTATKVEQKKQHHDPLDTVRGTLLHLTSMMQSNNQEIYKKFAHRVRSMNKRPPMPNTLGDPEAPLKTTEFSDFIQNIYVRLSKDHDTETAAAALISTARQHTSFIPYLQRAVSQLFARPKMKLPDNPIQDQPPTRSTAKFIDISWYTEDPYYKAVALQFADESNMENLNAVIAPTMQSETKKKRGERPRTSIEKRKTWDDVLKDYTLGEMVMVTPAHI